MNTNNKSMPEITIKAVFLATILIVVLAASNAYLGLKVGTTISASIPAVVIAMGIFRLFHHSSVLEINIVQTMASTGEGITAGIAFTMPALLIMRYWTNFNYWQTVGVGITGGILGVLFSVPLRRALLADKTLRFPEGTAIGQVMKVSEKEGAKIKPLIWGGVVGSLIGLFQTGFRVLAGSYDYWIVKANMIFGFGLGFSPAVIAAGYICGSNVGISTLIGVILGWVAGVPILSAIYGIPHVGHPMAGANQLWLDYIRYIGVGTMLVGGLWTLVTLFKPVLQGIMASFESLHEIRQGRASSISRTERDVPINFVFWGILIILAIMFFQFYSLIKPSFLNISQSLNLLIVGLCLIYTLVVGFIFSSVSGYFAGLIGATNSPGSGLLIAVQLGLSLILYFILKSHVNFDLHPSKALYAAAFSVVICAFIGAALVMTNESVQGLKAGSIVEGTPWKQQIILIVGVVISSLVLPLILNLLFNAYGIGGVFPHAGMDHSQMLSAPQAGLIAAVAQGVFKHNIPWNMVIVGGLIAAIGIVVDELLKKFTRTRLPVLAVGLGIYLPLNASIPIVIGGVLAYVVQVAIYRRHRKMEKQERSLVRQSLHDGLLLACGIVAGAAMVGVVLAIPFAITQSADVLRIMPERFSTLSGILSIIVTLLLCYWIFRVANKVDTE